MKNKNLVVFLVMTLLVSACGISGKSTTASLDKTHWVLEQINGKPVIENTLPTLSFNAEQAVAGDASCNRFMGTSTIKGNTLSFGSLGSTEMACLEPAGLMDQEAAYLAALETVKTYRIEDGKLVLVNASGEDVLRFSAQDMSLEGDPWHLYSFNDGQNLVSLVGESEITAQFSAGSISGTSGCNTYNGSYKLQDLDLSFESIASTLMQCEDENVMNQETAYLQALAKVTHYLVEGKQLTLYDANNLVIAQFSR